MFHWQSMIVMQMSFCTEHGIQFTFLLNTILFRKGLIRTSGESIWPQDANPHCAQNRSKRKTISSTGSGRNPNPRGLKETGILHSCNLLPFLFPFFRIGIIIWTWYICWKALHFEIMYVWPSNYCRWICMSWLKRTDFRLELYSSKSG